MGFRLRKGDEIVETPSVGMRDFLLTKQYEDISDSPQEVVLFEVEPSSITSTDTVSALFSKGKKGK